MNVLPLATHASTTARILRWGSEGFFSLRCFFVFFLSNLDEDEVTLVLEIEKDSDSILLCLERVREEGGFNEDIEDTFAIGPPTRVRYWCLVQPL
jgi:hypothetical protein